MGFYIFALVSAIVLQMALTDDKNEFKCGVRSGRTVPMMLNAPESVEGRWPWHVAVCHSPTKYACGGTLISRRHVLTAAHCTINHETEYPLNKESLFVVIGAHDLTKLQRKQRYSVQACDIHDNYTSGSHRYDIAIITLDSEVQFSSVVQPACVFLGQELTGMIGTVVGWGRTESNAMSRFLRETQLPVIDPITCLASNRHVFGPSLEKQMFCAGYLNGTGVCNGDSGGGIFIEVKGMWHLGGIVSFTGARDWNSTLCQLKGYSVFTKIHDYLPWIRSKTSLNHLIGDGDVYKSKFCPARSANATNTGLRKLPRLCGTYTPSRVNLGTRARVFEFPWMAQLIGERMVAVGQGSLIHKRYVLTATQFINRTILQKIRLGEHNVDTEIDCNGEGDCAPPASDFGIACIISHPGYNKRLRSNDIALIKLAKDVVFEDHIQPICLPVTSTLQQMMPQRYIFAGWGETETDLNSSVLMKATVQPMNWAQCQKIYKDTFRFDLMENHLCAGGKDLADGCMDDGGGPLGYTVEVYGRRFVQFGLLSFGGACGSIASVYTNVSSHMNWILANIDP